jgi:hypothetical protein
MLLSDLQDNNVVSKVRFALTTRRGDVSSIIPCHIRHSPILVVEVQRVHLSGMGATGIVAYSLSTPQSGKRLWSMGTSAGDQRYQRSSHMQAALHYSS